MTDEQKEKVATQEATANEQYLERTNNVGSLDNLVKAAEDYRKGIRKELWATGFPSLDEMLDGGLHGSQLVCIGAISSLGKTSFVLQAATQMAEQGRDVLIFSLEMSRDELNAKTVSRYSHILTEEDWQKMRLINEQSRFTTNEILKGDVNADNISIGDNCVFGTYRIDTCIYAPFDMGADDLPLVAEKIFASCVNYNPVAFTTTQVDTDAKTLCYTLKCSITFSDLINLGGGDNE